MNKKILIMIGIILLTAILVGGFYLWSEERANSTQTSEKKVTMGDKQKQLKSEITKTELIKKFEKLLREKGEKITLDKMDTSGWKTYVDNERQFSFKYPKDWYVIPIDSSKDIEEHYSFKNQRMEKKLAKRYLYNCDEDFINPSDIKGCVHPYNILCITDQYKYKKLPKKLVSPLSLYEYDSKDYCNIIIKEYLPVLKSSKKSSGEMLVESWSIGKGLSDITVKYLINKNNTYVNLGRVDFKKYKPWSIKFLLKNSNYLELMDLNYGTSIFNTIIQTIQYTN